MITALGESGRYTCLDDIPLQKQLYRDRWPRSLEKHQLGNVLQPFSNLGRREKETGGHSNAPRVVQVVRGKWSAQNQVCANCISRKKVKKAPVIWPGSDNEAYPPWKRNRSSRAAWCKATWKRKEAVEVISKIMAIRRHCSFRHAFCLSGIPCAIVISDFVGEQIFCNSLQLWTTWSECGIPTARQIFCESYEVIHRWCILTL